MDAPEHLTPEKSERGFSHLPAIDTWSGYTFPDGEFLNFDVVEPNTSGQVSVYESSDAVFPSLWLRVVDGDKDVTVLVTVDNARRLGEQLIFLADNHYSGVEVARCQHLSPSPWGTAQCVLPLDHEERHAYSPSEKD